jgi:ectoine hydroxylase-related dioxygenase (phytanoyl-CoA dioxygenase family)
VIANYLPEKECQEYLSRTWDLMEHLAEGKLKRNDLSTQKLSNCYPPVLHGGMIQYVGHSQLQWDLRKRCKPIFANIWKTNRLKSSFDGFCFMNGVRNYKPREANSFMHCDQAGSKDYLWSYQGLIGLTDSGEEGGGFVVVPRSHAYHREFFKKKGLLNNRENWYLLEEKDT